MKMEDIRTAKTSDLLLSMNLDRMKRVIINERAAEDGWPPGTMLGMSAEVLEIRAVARLEAVADEIDRRIPAPKDGG